MAEAPSDGDGWCGVMGCVRRRAVARACEAAAIVRHGAVDLAVSCRRPSAGNAHGSSVSVRDRDLRYRPFLTAFEFLHGTWTVMRPAACSS